MTPRPASEPVDREFYERELDEELRLYDPTNPVCRYCHVTRKERVQDLCAALLAERRSPTIAVDVGCGTGVYVPALATVASHVIGVELARSKARVAARRAGAAHATMIVGSATEIPMADGTCDLVLCSEVIEHFPDPDQVLVELIRIVKPTGSVVISTPVRYDVATWLRALTGGRNHTSRRLHAPDEHGHYGYFAPRELAKRLATLHADVISFAVVPRIHFPGLARLLRTRLISPESLLALGRRFPERGALGDLGGFGLLVARRHR
jgi:2-polyprenyl-3-methyl-5-hydroxy-6-metoxy-1,4-benzoquinol methylase